MYSLLNTMWDGDTLRPDVRDEILRHGERLLGLPNTRRVNGRTHNSAIQVLMLTCRSMGELETARRYAAMAPKYRHTSNKHMLGLYGDERFAALEARLRGGHAQSPRWN
jgi:hypothetical protein